MILSGLLLMAMVVFFAPGIFAMNRGSILRNIALWLAIFLGLALIYRGFGPNSPHPLFQLPESLSDMQKDAPAPAAGEESKKDPEKEPDNAGGQGFTPPKE